MLGLLSPTEGDILVMGQSLSAVGLQAWRARLGAVMQDDQLPARALYKQPAILFLDEATSHLDVGCEKLVNEAVAALKLTKVVIAHRPETIRMAGRVIDLGNAERRSLKTA